MGGLIGMVSLTRPLVQVVYRAENSRSAKKTRLNVQRTPGGQASINNLGSLMSHPLVDQKKSDTPCLT